MTPRSHKLPRLPWRGTAAGAVRAFGPALVGATVRRWDGAEVEVECVPGRCRVGGRRAAFDRYGTSRRGIPGTDRVEVVALDTKCCVAECDIGGRITAYHDGRLRCERRKETPIVFGGREDCAHPTCARHSHVVKGVRLCYGCDAERVWRP